VRPQKFAIIVGASVSATVAAGAPVDSFGAVANALRGLFVVGFVVVAHVAGGMVVGLDVATPLAVGPKVVGTLLVGSLLSVVGSEAVCPMDIGVAVTGIGDGLLVLGAPSGSRSSLLGLATYSRTTSNELKGLRTVPEYKRGVTPVTSFIHG
jgi:hypothetical protein